MSETVDIDINKLLTLAAGVIETKPQQALEAARQIAIQAGPSRPVVQIMAGALRNQQAFKDAIDLVGQYPEHTNHPLIQLELALCHEGMGEFKQSDKLCLALTDSLSTNLNWVLLNARRLVRDNQWALAHQALAPAIGKLLQADAQKQAQSLIETSKLKRAEELLRQQVSQYPTNVVALAQLADLAIKLDQYDDAIALTTRALQIAPAFALARFHRASALQRRGLLHDALDDTQLLLKIDAQDINFLLMHASVMVRLGDHENALNIYDALIQRKPEATQIHLNRGHVLKTLGRSDDAISAYLKAVELDPGNGEAYWSLANLKTYQFGDAMLKQMLRQIEEKVENVEAQSHLGFAIGKAYEDRKQFDDSFKFYKRGNTIRKIAHKHSAKINIYNVQRQIALFTEQFLTERRDSGNTSDAPIFVVGLPRAGSTLIEQILSSHSMVEATTELTDVIAMSRRIGGKRRHVPASKYPEILADFDTNQLRDLGDSYLETTNIHRTGLPRFIDKMPNNFMHIGLISLMLPNAKIIDARRHPMAAGFACYKQLFAQGQTYTYDLEDVGHYYRSYITLMDHWNKVLPGKVHLVQYENMVANSEQEIRALLDFCELPFEQGCIDFHQSERAVRTPSAEQVRQPIYTSAREQWRNYEQHLGPLKDALGPVLDRF